MRAPRPVNNTRLLTARVMHFVSLKSAKNSLTSSIPEFAGDAVKRKGGPMIARKHKGETRDPVQLAEQRAAEAA